jgi:hypothetical protein
MSAKIAVMSPERATAKLQRLCANRPRHDPKDFYGHAAILRRYAGLDEDTLALGNGHDVLAARLLGNVLERGADPQATFPCAEPWPRGKPIPGSWPVSRRRRRPGDAPRRQKDSP